jgi:hypothetical protein
MNLVRTGIFAGLIVVSVAGHASAALTVSEQAQVKSFVGEAKVATAIRVRAMVARPDLSIDESSQALKESLVPVAFDDARAAYLKELAFGQASEPSRPVLAVAITRAVLARADALLAKHAGDLDAQPPVLAELSRIYAFLTTAIANAGQPRGAAHDPQIGIPASSYDDCVKAIGEHVAKNPRWLKGDATLTAAIVPVRAQLQLALADMTNDAPARRVDAADRLGLVGARRTLFTELGVLVLDAGLADSARVDRVRAILARLPGARGEVEAVYFGDARPSLKARGTVVGVKTPLEAPATAAADDAFTDEVEGVPVDALSLDVARELARVAVKRALEARPELRAQGEKDARAAGTDPKKQLGAPDAPSVDAVLAAAARLLVLDAPRALDLAMVRLIGGAPESSALLVDALGALAAYAPATSTPNGLAVPLGHMKPDGTSETVLATNVRVAPAGYVTGFTLQGHAWAFNRDDAGAMTVKRDNAPLALNALPNARLPVVESAVWSGGGLTFARMQGTPRAGIAPGPRVRVVGFGAKGFDAIATAAPGDDVVVEGDLTAQGEVVIAVRVIAGKDTLKGITLTILAAQPGQPRRALLRSVDDAGKMAELAPPADLAAGASHHVKVVVKGGKIEASIGSATLKAAIPAAFAHGDVALGARKGASLEMGSFSVRRP